MTTNAKPAIAKKVIAKNPATGARKAASGSRASKATPATKSAKVVQSLKKEKPEKIKMVRDSFSLPEGDYAKLIDLKKKCIAAGVHVKKSELMRLGLLQLSKLGNTALITSAKRIASVKNKKTSKD
jgi:DNA-binding transcriptional regulator YiaG